LSAGEASAKKGLRASAKKELSAGKASAEKGRTFFLLAPARSPHPPVSAGSNEHVDRAIKEGEQAKGCTRGTVQGFWRIVPLATNVCRATFVFQTTAGGRVPVLAMNFGVKTALAIAEVLRDKYERGGKAVDAELRDALPPPPLMNTLNEEQTRVAKSCLGLETASANSMIGWTPLKSSSPFVSISMQYAKPVGSESR
jgi:hypothetical protein